MRFLFRKLKAVSDAMTPGSHEEGLPDQSFPTIEEENGSDVEGLMRLAEQGDVESQTKLALLYEIGRDVVQDFSAAIEWYRKAADQGHAHAMSNLG